MDGELVTVQVELPGGALELRQPAEWAQLPDDREVEWAPLAPYWSVMWRSGVALARRVSATPLTGVSVIELGCGLGVPSLAAARAGATVLATDADPEALQLLRANAEHSGLKLRTQALEWEHAPESLERFDLVLAADVLYERSSVATLARLMSRLAPRALLADPGRPLVDEFLELVDLAQAPTIHAHGVATVRELEFA